MTAVKVIYRQIEITFYRSSLITWVCPVCGFPSLTAVPYAANGLPTFTMCPFCMFEFGFDDNPAANGEADNLVIESWSKYRTKFLAEIALDHEKVEVVKERLERIHIKVT